MSDKGEKMTDLSNVKEGEVKGEVKEKTAKADNSDSSPSSTNKVTVRKKEFKSLSSEELATLDYKDFGTPARMLALGQVMAGSKLCIHKTKEDFAVAMMMGQELGLPLSASLSQIYAINGKPSLGVHIQKGLLISKGVLHEKIEDFVTIYSFAEADENGRTKLKTVKNDKGEDVRIPANVLGEGTLAEQPENSTKRAIDTRTTYELTRLIKREDGKYKELKVRGSFSIKEAYQAGLMEKENYAKYPKRMLDARAYSNAAHDIADDILNGVLTPGEMGANVLYNEQGQEIVIDTDYEEVN